MKDEIKLEAVETSDLKVEYAQHQAEIRVNEMLSQEGGDRARFDDVVSEFKRSCHAIFDLEGSVVVDGRLENYPQYKNPHPLEVQRDQSYWEFILYSNLLSQETGLYGKALMDATMVGGLNAFNSPQVVKQYKNESAPYQGEESGHRGGGSHGFFYYGKK